MARADRYSFAYDSLYCRLPIHLFFSFWCMHMDYQMDEVAGNLKVDENLLESVLMHMGSMYSVLGKFEKSMLMYRRAIGILENIYGKCMFVFNFYEAINFCDFLAGLMQLTIPICCPIREAFKLYS